VLLTVNEGPERGNVRGLIDWALEAAFENMFHTAPVAESVAEPVVGVSIEGPGLRLMAQGVQFPSVLFATCMFTIMPTWLCCMSSIEKAVLANVTAQVVPSTFRTPLGRVVSLHMPYSVNQMGSAFRAAGRLEISLIKILMASKGIANTEGEVGGVGGEGSSDGLPNWL
jgi:hypothetical protein